MNDTPNDTTIQRLTTMQREEATTSTSTPHHHHHHPTKRRRFVRKMSRPSFVFITFVVAILFIAINSLATSSSVLSSKHHLRTTTTRWEEEPGVSYETTGSRNIRAATNENNNRSPRPRLLLSTERNDYIASSKNQTGPPPPARDTQQQQQQVVPSFDLLSPTTTTTNSSNHSVLPVGLVVVVPHDDPQLVSIMEAPRIDKVQPHYFVFPETKTPEQQQQQQQQHLQLMCVPQKNGNQQMAGLFYALHNQGQVLQLGRHKDSGLKLIRKLTKMNVHHGDWPSSSSLSSSMGKNEDEEEDIIIDGEGEEEERQLFVVSRNPYTRVLSYWMDKIQRTNKDANFTEFVQYLESKTKKEALIRLCRIDHHLCSQVSVCLRPALAATADSKNNHNNNNSTSSSSVAQPTPTIYKLKLEEQASWFPWLLQVTNSNTSLLHGEQFVPFSGTPCFYTPTGNCSDMTTTKKIMPPTTTELQNKNTTTTTTTTTVVQVGKRHPTGASKGEMMNLHHNAYTASVISNLYREDFELFEYPSWDGVSPWRTT